MLLSTCRVLQAMEEAPDEGGEGQRSGFSPSPWQLGGLTK